MKKIILLFAIALAGCHSNKPTAPFTIGKVIKTTEGATIDVQINSRLSKRQMVDIAARIKSDSSQYAALQVDFLLPGNNYKNTGGINVYAMANYPKPGAITPKDTVSDDDKNLLSFEFIGFTPEKAKQMLALNPTDMAGKMVVGKFIDDNIKTISILYDDKREGQFYILELDTAGKVVSATQPLVVTHNGIQKMVITKRGDYCTLKDSILTMYSIDDPETPYRSIKDGI
jgi:hypothetical protein